MAGEWQGSAYDDVSTPQFRWGAEVLEWLETMPIRQGRPLFVLDAGCGSGRVTELLLERREDVVVVAGDSSPSMLDEAAERLAAFQNRAHIVPLDLEGDVTGALSGFARFDAVVSTGTFHWVRNHRAMYGELREILTPGGLLVAQCGGEGSVGEVRAVLDELDIDWRSFNRYAGAAESQASLREAGFIDVRTWLSDESVAFGSAEHVAEYLLGGVLAPYVAHLPAAEQRAVADTVAGRLENTVVNFVRLNMLGRKS